MVDRVALIATPILLMILVVIGITGIEHWLAAFGKTQETKLLLGRAGIALPFVIAAAGSMLFLFAAAGSIGIRYAG
jgi:type IV secretion system protein VirD4